MKPCSSQCWLVSRMTAYPNDNFVVQGRRTPLWEKSGLLSNNCQRTSGTTERLTQNSLYSADNYRLPQRGYVSGVGSDADSTPSYYASNESYIVNDLDMDDSTKKTVSFNKKHRQTGLSNGFGSASAPDTLMNGLLTNGDPYLSGQESDHSSSQSGAPKTKDQFKWYTQPIHLEKKDYTSGYHHGSMAASLAANGKLDSDFAPPKDMDHRSLANYSPSSVDILARDFFPTTLGAAYALQSMNPSSTKSVSGPAKGLPKPNQTPWRPKRSRSPSRKNRPGSAHSSSSSTSKSSLDKMYLMTVEAPTVGSSPAVLLSSPYQHELARLRMDRLRIEEDHLLEVKRQEEMERIRGPQPKWYELKSPRFHYEAHKNNELTRNSKNYQALLDYRGELEKASKEFKRSHNYNSTS